MDLTPTEQMLQRLHQEKYAAEDRARACELMLLQLARELGLLDEYERTPSAGEVHAATQKYLDGVWGRVAPQRG